MTDPAAAPPPAATPDAAQRLQLAEAETKALEAEKKRIDAQLALAEAHRKLDAPPNPPTAPDPDAAALAAARRAKELADADKAAADARTAAFKARVGGVPDSGIAGDVTLGDKAGSLEAMLLAHRALAGAARRVAEVVRTTLAPAAPEAGGEPDSAAEAVPLTVYLCAAAQLPSFQSVASFNAQRGAVQRALDLACTAVAGEFAQGQAELEAVPELALTPAMVGIAFESISKLLGFFRSDFKFAGSEVTLDDTALVQAVAGHDLHARTRVPGLYFPQAVGAAATLFDTDLQALAAQRAQAGELAGRLDRRTADLQRQSADTALPAAGKAGLDARTVQLHALAEQLKVATAACDTLIGRLLAPDEATGAMLRELALWQALTQPGSRLLLVKVQRAGGSNYVEKNLRTFFGRMPFFVAGGAVVSYTLLQGDNGQVLASGLLPVHGGFVSVKDVPDLLPSPR